MYNIKTYFKDNIEYRLKDGKIFFIDPPVNIRITSELSPKQKIKEEWTDWRKANYDFFKKELEKVNSDSIVLDFGAGPSQFEELTSKFRNLIGIDFYPYEKVNVICDLSKPLPFKDNIVDAIIASNVFEHLPNTHDVFEECLRILKPNGVLIGTIPFLLRVHQTPYDFHRYTYIMLEKLLKDAGFIDVKVINLGTSFNLYKIIQKHFFRYLFDDVYKIKNPIHRKLKLWLVKIVWNLQELLNLIAGPILKNCPQTIDFTAGYGFYGRKNKS